LIHYHCADISGDKFLELAGHHLLVSHAYPRRVSDAHDIAATMLLDNGAYTAWTVGKEVDWNDYYTWVEPWIGKYPTTWCVIPDIVDGGEEIQDKLISQWPHNNRGSPVWHLDEPIPRLLSLIDGGWPRVCLGSAGEYAEVASNAWMARMNCVFNKVDKTFGQMPWLHGLRMQGIACGRSSGNFPFGSVDSADVARNNNRKQNTITKMVTAWDKQQPRVPWRQRPEQRELADFTTTL